MASALDLSKSGQHINELETLFSDLNVPYGHGDIVRFNLLYQRIYHELNRDERARAEQLVDVLIAGVARDELRSKIFGVV